jgi:hypothetical protein
MLAKDPDQRPQAMSEVALSLAAVATSGSTGALPLRGASPTRARWMLPASAHAGDGTVATVRVAEGRMRPRLAVVAGTLVVAVMAVVAWRLLPRSLPAVQPLQSAPYPPAPAFVSVELEGAPPGVVVLVDGAPSPLPIRLPRSNDRHQLEFRAPGRRPLSMTIDGTKDRSISLMMPATLEASAASPPPAGSKRGGRGRRSAAEGARPDQPPATARKSKDVIFDL